MELRALPNIFTLNDRKTTDRAAAREAIMALRSRVGAGDLHAYFRDTRVLIKEGHLCNRECRNGQKCSNLKLLNGDACDTHTRTIRKR